MKRIETGLTSGGRWLTSLALAAPFAVLAQTAPAATDGGAETPTLPVQALPETAPAETKVETSAAPAQPARLEEVVVTATKRRENIRKIPASIVRLDGVDLERRGAQDTVDIVKLVPGVNITSTGDTPARITIRGISSDIGTGSTTGILFGNVSFSDTYVPFVALDPNPFDLGGVEILKGPQGTLFGAGALNGAVRYVPTRPAFDELSLRWFAQNTWVHEGDDKPIYGAAANIPLFGDEMALRVTGFRRRAPGYVDNTQLGKDTNELDQEGLRGILAWQPTEKWDISLTGAWQDTQLRDVGVTDNDQGNLVVGNRPRKSPNHSRYYFGDLTAAYSFDWAQLTSDTSYVKKKGDNFFDASSRVDPGGTLPINAQAYSANSDTYAQEFRLVSANDRQSRWKWTTGVFLYQQDLLNVLRVPLAQGNAATQALIEVLGAGSAVAQTLLDVLGQTAPDPTGPLFTDNGEVRTIGADADVQVKEQALFGDVTRKLGESFELSVGGRLYKTKSGGTNTQSGIVVLAERGMPTYVIRDGVSEQGFNPKASLTWNINNDVLTYVGASKGFRVGGIQFGLTTPVSQKPAPDTFKSDTLWNYETGIRTQWFNKTLRFDLTGYYVNWKDPQSVQADASGLAVYIDNVGGVHSKGADLALQYAIPSWGVKLTGSGSYADTRTSKPFTASNGEVVPSGTRYPVAPRWQSAVSLSVLQPVGAGFSVAGVITHTYLGGANSDLVLREPIFNYRQLDASLSLLNTRRKWIPEITLIANNLLDERGITNHFNNRIPTADSAADEVYYITPRSLTLRLAGKFGGPRE